VVSPFNWFEKVIEDVEEQVWQMLSAEALHGGRVKGPEDQTEEEEVIINRLIMKYSWWTPKVPAERKNK
jgi:hypothetical protein